MTYTDKKKSSSFETPSGLKYSGFFRFFWGGGDKFTLLCPYKHNVRVGA